MLNNLPIKDTTDWFEAGGAAQELKKVAETAHAWTPETSSFLFSTLFGVEKEKRSWRTFDSVPLGQFMASGDAEITWVIKGILPTESVTILAAPEGYGKSWMLLDLAIECARGGQW